MSLPECTVPPTNQRKDLRLAGFASGAAAISACRAPLATMAAGGEKYDYVFKFIIIGDTGTGKSCLLHQFVEGKCDSRTAPHAPAPC